MKNEIQKGISIVIPCLNEEQTIAICIKKAKNALKDLSGSYKWEIIVADNGSIDRSIEIAESLDAKVVTVQEKGYGSALRGGIKTAKYDYIIMGDADNSYDFSVLMPFIEKLEDGYELVMGNRFKGGIEPKAMPWTHRYIGNPALSGIGRLFYKTDIGDFHCGMRAFRKSSIERLKLSTTGMEFASEMVVKSILFKLKITEVPCRLYPDGRSRPPHLRSIPDGLRHLLFLLIYSPRWLFLYPGFIFSVSSCVLLAMLFIRPLQIFSVKLEIITMFYAATGLILGLQAIQFSVFTNIYGRRIGQFPDEAILINVTDKFMMKQGFILSLLLIAAGILGIISTYVLWAESGFGELVDTSIHRSAILYGTILIIGFQLLFSSFFTNVLHMGGEV